MGALVGCSRLFLVLINGIFAIIGLVFLVVGCLVRFGAGFLDPYLQDFYKALANFIEESGSTADLSNFNLGTYLQDASLAMILIGVFFFLIGIFGCVGGCCQVKCMLIVYIILITLIVLAEVIFVILLFTIRSTIDTNLKQPMLKSIKDDYQGINGTNIASLGWNFAMINYQCCGVDNYTDFHNASKWTAKFSRSGFTVDLQAPLACCKMNDSSAFPNVKLPTDLTCATSPTVAISNISKGCYKKLWDLINDNSNIIIGVGVGVLVVELLLLVFSFVVCCRNKDKSDIDYDYD